MQFWKWGNCKNFKVVGHEEMPILVCGRRKRPQTKMGSPYLRLEILTITTFSFSIHSISVAKLLNKSARILFQSAKVKIEAEAEAELGNKVISSFNLKLKMGLAMNSNHWRRLIECIGGTQIFLLWHVSLKKTVAGWNISP